MPWAIKSFLIFAMIMSSTAFAVEENAIGTIHKMDMTDEGGPKAPNYILLILDVKKAKVPGARAHVILRQLRKRVRIEFEGTGLPKGKYKIGLADNCSKANNFKAGWTELQELKVISLHTITEKANFKLSLREPKPGLTVVEGKALGLFRVNGSSIQNIDCKTIQ